MTRDWEETYTPLVAIVGPTAVGKSALGLGLAEELGGEIVSADSRLVYRYLDIGTAKPLPEERARVPHHMIDLVDPDAVYTVAEFVAQAKEAIAAIYSQGRLPILAGGTGLYIKALLEGYQIPATPPNWSLRKVLEDRLQQEGLGALFSELERLDRVVAQRVDHRNPRRVIRTLEVAYALGGQLSAWGLRERPAYHILTIGLTLERAELYRRIDQRVDDCIARGWVEEVAGLLAKGYTLDLPSMSSIGYHQIGQCVLGQLSLSEAIEWTKRATHRVARGQYAWFRLSDPTIHWLVSDNTAPEKALALVVKFLRGRMASVA